MLGEIKLLQDFPEYLYGHVEEIKHVDFLDQENFFLPKCLMGQVCVRIFYR